MGKVRLQSDWFQTCRLVVFGGEAISAHKHEFNDTEQKAFLQIESARRSSIDRG